MADNTMDPHASAAKDGRGKKPGGFLGSLRDALQAAGREDAHHEQGGSDHAGRGGVQPELLPPPPPVSAAAPPPNVGDLPPMKTIAPKSDDALGAQGSLGRPQTPPAAAAKMSAAEAAEAVRRQRIVEAETAVEVDVPPTTAVVRKKLRPSARDDVGASNGAAPAKTQMVRGQAEVKRGAFERDPVVGWLVIVGGPGIGNFRPIHEGNNTLGRADTQRIPIDFGDTAISSEEQAFIRYDSSDRSFLFVPNMTKTNVVSVNDRRPTTAVPLQAMDVIAMGRTQLVFVPFCGPDFDWSELLKSGA